MERREKGGRVLIWDEEEGHAGMTEENVQKF